MATTKGILESMNDVENSNDSFTDEEEIDEEEYIDVTFKKNSDKITLYSINEDVYASNEALITIDDNGNEVLYYNTDDNIGGGLGYFGGEISILKRLFQSYSTPDKYRAIPDLSLISTNYLLFYSII